MVCGAEAALNSECELWTVSCLLTSGHRRLPSAFEGPQVSRRAGRDLRYACPPPTAHSRLPTPFEGGGMERALGRHSRPGQDVAADRGRKN
jgi:hypothetical protein